jgi:hypothetical protein
MDFGLEHAVMLSRHEMASMLLQYDWCCRPETSGGRQLLFDAVVNNDADMVRLLCQFGAGPDLECKSSYIRLVCSLRYRSSGPLQKKEIRRPWATWSAARVAIASSSFMALATLLELGADYSKLDFVRAISSKFVAAVDVFHWSREARGACCTLP